MLLLLPLLLSLLLLLLLLVLLLLLLLLSVLLYLIRVTITEGFEGQPVADVGRPSRQQDWRRRCKGRGRGIEGLGVDRGQREHKGSFRGYLKGGAAVFS